MEPAEFKAMVRDVRRAKASIGCVTYNRTEKEENGLAGRRSLYAVEDIAQGELFTSENVRSIRPAYGVAPKHLDELLGHAAPRDIKFGEPITPADLENL